MNKAKIDNINVLSLSLFNAVIEHTEGTPDFIKNYGVALTEGSSYARKQILSFLKSKKLTGDELNKTFHKSWSVIQNSSREELMFHQILHYLTTYGTDFKGGFTYIPVEELDIEGKQLPVYVIDSLTKDELIEKCESMLSSGIAMAEKTMKDVLALLGNLGYTFTSVDWVKNKEAKIVIMDRDKIYPDDPGEFLRYVIYKSTGTTLLIKSNDLIEQIKDSGYNPNALFNKYGLDRLAQVFNRFKPIFLAFKKNGAKKSVNRIAKLSKTHHVPMVENPLNKVTSRVLEKDELHWLDNATAFALFKAMNVCSVRRSGQEDFVYKIRNGKTWVASGVASDETVLMTNMDTIMTHLQQRFKDALEGKKVYIPANIKYGLPTSEKMFIGNFPIGTKVIADKLAVGIYWENSFGAHDLDLSGLSASGKIGWNGSYRNRGMMYSGDMTYAPDGAVEYLYTNHLVEDTLIKVNCYSGDYNDHAYNIIVAVADEPDRKYMMNPENLILNERFQSTSGESFTGLVYSDGEKLTFTMFPLCGSQARVSGFDSNSLTAQQAFVEEAKNSLTLDDVLVMMGVDMVDNPADADIDLSPEKIEKSTFIELFKE